MSEAYLEHPTGEFLLHHDLGGLHTDFNPPALNRTQAGRLGQIDYGSPVDPQIYWAY